MQLKIPWTKAWLSIPDAHLKLLENKALNFYLQNLIKSINNLTTRKGTEGV